MEKDVLEKIKQFRGVVRQKQGEYFTFHKNFLQGALEFETVEEQLSALVAIIVHGIYGETPVRSAETAADRAALIADGFIGAILDRQKERRELRRQKRLESQARLQYNGRGEPPVEQKPQYDDQTAMQNTPMFAPPEHTALRIEQKPQCDDQTAPSCADDEMTPIKTILLRNKNFQNFGEQKLCYIEKLLLEGGNNTEADLREIIANYENYKGTVENPFRYLRMCIVNFYDCKKKNASYIPPPHSDEPVENDIVIG
jgi:hypothetical protein